MQPVNFFVLKHFWHIQIYGKWWNWIMENTNSLMCVFELLLFFRVIDRNENSYFSLSIKYTSIKIITTGVFSLWSINFDTVFLIFSHFFKRKNKLWPLFTDRVQPFQQSCRATTKRQFTFKNCLLVLIWSTSGEWKTESTYGPPKALGTRTPELGILPPNYWTIVYPDLHSFDYHWNSERVV